MTIPTSNISFSKIQSDFGGSNPISMSEYYRSGSYLAFQQYGFPNGVRTSIPNSGQVSVSNYANSGKTYTIAILIVGGGGGGGSGWPDNIGGGGGGGGGGGVRRWSQSMTLGGLSTSIVVGTGGTAYGYPTTQSGAGGDSSFTWESSQFPGAKSATATGGLGGYGRDNTYNLRGGTSGSGDSAGNQGGTWGGNPGGSDGLTGGGGGGGTDDANNTSGVGGNGVQWINGTYYAGGGGGGGDYSYGAAGGAGGGGHGGSGADSVTAGANGYGGGGGGGSSTGGGSWGYGANGGSGVVIVAYDKNYGQILTGGTLTSDATYYYHTFTTSGSIAVA